MAKKTEFQSLQDVTDAYETKNGTAFHARLSAFLAKDGEVSEVGDRFAVKTFTNLANATDTVNDRLKTEFVDDDEFETVPANITYFVNTKEEADALAETFTKGSRLSAPVVVSSHEYNDSTYLDLLIETPYLTAPEAGNGPVAASTKSAAKKSTKAKATKKEDAADISDEDLPF